MKEVLGSLPEVITAYKNYNLLVPTATDVQLNPFYKFHVEEVPVDLGENSGDIFKVGSVKTGKQDEKGKDIWEDVFSLSKPLLNKMAMAAGIQFNPKETYGERIDRVTYRAQAQGAMRKADGTARTETDQKVICLEDEEEKYRIEFADKATKGITDEKQAQAAAEIFSGQWVESKNKWGKKCQAFVVAKEDRDRYIDRSVMVNMALLKKTWAEKAMTGAKLRVIRALLGVKGTYTKAELQKNFAIPTVIFSPDFSDPQVRQAMLTQGMNSVNNMFGTPQIAVKSVDFESESTVFTQDDLNNPAYAYEALKQAFSQDGVPHQIIRNIIPHITDTTNNILGQMTGGTMGVEFVMERTVKGKDGDKATLDVLINEYGKTTLPYASKSGGEKVKASLAVILALSEIKATAAGIQLGMLFIDEPPFLDDEGAQAYVDALETIRDRYSDVKIMAITHDDAMKARFGQAVTVIKTDDGSKVIY